LIANQLYRIDHVVHPGAKRRPGSAVPFRYVVDGGIPGFAKDAARI
jgi:hypothetical protein